MYAHVEESGMREKRNEQRWPTYLGGRISFLKGQATADCLIRDKSENGAKLIIFNGRFVPDDFDLMVRQRDAIYRARARWRSRDEIGVTLEPANAAAQPIPLSMMRELKQIEAENERLKARVAELSE
jgi:hypothetical protein